MFNKNKNVDTLEYIMGRVDRTNPIHFKEKNDFFLQNADTIITSVQKKNKNIFIKLLGSRFPLKNYNPFYDPKNNRFVIPVKAKKQPCVDYYNDVSKVIDKNSQIKNLNGKELFNKISNEKNVMSDEEILKKYRNLKFPNYKSSKSTIISIKKTGKSKSNAKAVSSMNSTNYSFLSRSKSLTRKSSDVFNEKFKVSKSSALVTDSKAQTFNTTITSRKKSVMSKSQPDLNKDEVYRLKTSSFRPYFNKKINMNNNSNSINRSSRSEKTLVYIPEKINDNLSNKKSKFSKSSPKDKKEFFCTLSKFKPTEVKANIKEKIMGDIVNKDFINNLKEFSRKIKIRNEGNNKSCEKRENLKKELMSTNKSAILLRPKKKNRKISLSYEKDIMNRSMNHLGFSKTFKRLKKIKRKNNQCKSAIFLKSLWLQKMIKMQKPLTEIVEKLLYFDKKLALKLKKEEDKKKSEEYSYKNLIFPGFKSRLEKAYEVFEIDDKTRKILKTMCKNIFGYEEDDLDRRLREIKLSVLKSQKDSFDFQKYFEEKYPWLKKIKNSKEIAGTSVLHVPPHFTNNYMDNIDLKSKKEVHNNIIRDFQEMKKINDIDKELFFDAMSRKNHRIIKENYNFKNSKSLYKTCDYLSLENKLLKREMLLNKAALEKSSLYLDPTWCVCINSKDINIFDPTI